MPPVVPVLLPVPVLVVAVVAVVTVVVMTVLSVLLIVVLGGVVASRLGRRQFFHDARLWKSLVTQRVAVKLGESCVIVAHTRNSCRGTLARRGVCGTSAPWFEWGA